MEKRTRTIGIIHAVNLTIRAMQPFLERYIPDVEVMHLCDDTIQRDNIAAGIGVIPRTTTSSLRNTRTTCRKPKSI